MKTARSNAWFFGVTIMSSIVAGVIAHFKPLSMMEHVSPITALVVMLLMTPVVMNWCLTEPSPTLRASRIASHVFAANLSAMMGVVWLLSDHKIPLHTIPILLLIFVFAFLEFHKEVRTG